MARRLFDRLPASVRDSHVGDFNRSAAGSHGRVVPRREPLIDEAGEHPAKPRANRSALVAPNGLLARNSMGAT